MMSREEKSVRKMEVIKRDGRHESVSFDKITERIKAICTQLNLKRINPVEVAMHTINGLRNLITTEELDLHAANVCAERIMDDPEYNKLAAGICVSNLQKMTSSDFLETTMKLFNNISKNGKHNPLVTQEYVDYVTTHHDKIQATLDYSRDFYFDFFAIKTLERAYLFRVRTHSPKTNSSLKELRVRDEYGRIVERPQHLFMREAIAVNMDNIDAALNTYYLLSELYYTHASPTMYNAATPRPQLSSCFLLGMDDNITGIYKTIADTAEISKLAGGIGISGQDIRSFGSEILGTNGVSDGIVPLAQMFNSSARYVNQGGRRNGAIALYLEPWHADIFAFCELRRGTGDDERRARDLFIGLWIPDLFMERVKSSGKWSLMCPNECPGLTEAVGEKFNELYKKYESEGRYRKQIDAKTLWFHILDCQIETGMPYMCYKDPSNQLSNQRNLGTIKSSNLCTEIIEYSDSKEYAVCNLASIGLPRFVVKADKPYFDYDKLFEVTKIVTKNLDRVIDVNYYPVPEARRSNMRHRPIGLGVQGLADVYAQLGLPFSSDGAREVNKRIFETIYYASLTMSNELAREFGPYETFPGSPFSKGELQWHAAGLTEKDLLMGFDWSTLIESIKQCGTRNSQLTALMPTASTSQILCNTEAFEPFTSNLFTRKTLTGEFVVINSHLVEELIALGLWTRDIRNEFIYDNGSVQKISAIPDKIKEVYKTAYEMQMKPIVDQAVDRAPFIDQSQSMNLFSAKPTHAQLTSAHFYGWSKKLKTGMYYLRTHAAASPLKFGVDPAVITEIRIKRGEIVQTVVKEEKPEKDERRLSEIEVANARADAYKPCDVCSG